MTCMELTLPGCDCPAQVRQPSQTMSGEERRHELLDLLSASREPISGRHLADHFKVSRQVIVQDIALLRANGLQIFSTSRGYYLQPGESQTRVFKVRHTEEQVEEELNLIVDLGGRVEDVFVYHKVYGVVRAELHLKSRWEVRKYLDELGDGQSSLLMNVTSGYHYHTVSADSKETLDLIQEQLAAHGFLAPLRDYEPVNFW